ncbi:lipocalin family protein [Sediminicoccus sp. KRV36]|uniref:lipocalin family protein n=1 Tax=Sediminicoccus sp. KRV36 TaxID=3133721 RepID=UPI00200D0E11|nr:lipocalin family protein [Sediminicoccus rosea]UPY35282.1 lipocalin family protein [Sediminicoccus rosea]
MRALLLAALLGLAACGATQPTAETPRTVESVDVSRYLGLWHEVARLPQRFQDSASLRCEEVTAEYAPLGAGRISVVNSCVNALDPARPTRVARGEAYVVEGSNNTRLRVSFFWPFHGDYWVLGLDPDYRWALVGAPSRRSLWLLSRTPSLPPAELERALAIARAQGFDLAPLVLSGR